jgi:hypothetical protein
VIVSCTVLEVPLAFAVIFAIDDDDTGFVVIVKLFDVAPPGTVILDDTIATCGRELEIVTTRRR